MRAIPEMIYQMLSCFYDRNYEDDTNCKNPLDFNAVMYAIADKYDVPLLKDLAEMKFSAAIVKRTTTMTPHLVKAIKIVYSKFQQTTTAMSHSCFQGLWSESGKQSRDCGGVEIRVRGRGFHDGSDRCLGRISKTGASSGSVRLVEECLLHLAYQEQVIALRASSSSTL